MRKRVSRHCGYLLLQLVQAGLAVLIFLLQVLQALLYVGAHW